MNEIRVIQWGLGAMGSGMARLMQSKTGLKIVGAYDQDPQKIGQDLGEFLGGVKSGVRIKQPPQPGEMTEKADLVILATSSFTKDVAPQIETALKHSINVISIAEEMAYPWTQEPRLAKRLDELAREYGVSVLGTGINPGFVLDTLILALTGTCLQINQIKAARINDLSPFGPTVMRTQGVGMGAEAFEAGLQSGEIVGHVGFKESIHLLTKTLGWKLDRIEETRFPIISNVYRETAHVKVEPGQVAGCKHTAVGYVNGVPKIELIHPQQVLPQLEGIETGDYIDIKGKPDIHLAIKPEIPGGLGTMAMAVNMIPQVLAARPGLLSMAELPVPAALMGDVRELLAWRKGE